MAASPLSETPKSDRPARLRDMLDKNRKVCQELKEAVENCIAKAAGGEEQTPEETQPS